MAQPPHLSHWQVSEFQPPNVPYGGRANTIAVHPLNNSIVLVASKSGGLFRSANGGQNWRHVDNLPVLFTNAVAFIPANPNVIIATVGEDYHTATSGGIWRSTNGGNNWVHIVKPPAPAGITDRFEASEIAINEAGAIFVATKYGVAISTDQGMHWRIVDPFPVGGRVVSVSAQGSLVLAGGPAGIRRSPDEGMTWFAPTTSPGGIVDMHAFGAVLGGSPLSQSLIFVVNANTELYYTVDLGENLNRPGFSGGCFV